jgi:hypothetical protein
MPLERLHLRECSIVPDVTVMWEAVADVSQAALFDVLLDGIQELLLGDFHLCVSPAGDLNDHVEDAVVLIREQRYIMEWGDDAAIVFDVDPML